MARGVAAVADLEALPVPGNEPAWHPTPPGTPTRRRRPRWWPFVAAAAVAAALVGGHVVTARAAARRVDRAWATYQAIDRDRITLSDRLRDTLDGDTFVDVQQAVAAAHRSEIVRLHELGDEVRRAWTADAGVRRTRDAVERALDLNARRLALPPLDRDAGDDDELRRLSGRVGAATTEAERRVADQRARWHLGRPELRASATRLTAPRARAALRRLDRLADGSTGGLRLVGATNALSLVDVDAGTVGTVFLPAPRRPVLALVSRPGWLAVLAGGRVHVLDDDGVVHGNPAFENVDALVAHADPAFVWLARGTTDGQRAEAVDRRGTPTGERALLPPRFVLRADVGAAGLAVAGDLGTGVALVDRAGANLRVISADGSYVAAGGTTVAWSSCRPVLPTCQLLLTDAATGATRPVRFPPEVRAVNTGAVDPTGRWLAVRVLDDRRPLSHAAVIDVTTAEARILPGLDDPFGYGGPLTWTPDGRWLVGGIDAGRGAAAWPVGAAQARHLRLHRLDLSFAALAAR